LYTIKLGYPSLARNFCRFVAIGRPIPQLTSARRIEMMVEETHVAQSDLPRTL
jgi:hypothetical protein